MQTKKDKNFGNTKIPTYKKKWENLSLKQKVLREKSLDILSQARKNDNKKSISKLAKENNISIKTIQHNTNALKKVNSRWQVKKIDKIHRVMKVNENGKEISIKINDSRTASLIGRYANATKLLLNNGDKKQLQKFKNKKIKDVDGNFHTLETDSDKIIEINQKIEEREFYELYQR